MLSCINPMSKQIEENVSTLEYSSKASDVINKPIQNIDPSMVIINELKDRINILECELNRCKNQIECLHKNNNDESYIEQNKEYKEGLDIIKNINLINIHRDSNSSRNSSSEHKDSINNDKQVNNINNDDKQVNNN